MENYIFSVDAGKGFTKYAKADVKGNIQHDSFLTRYTKIEDLNDIGILGEDSYLVEYDDDIYILGVQGEYDLRESRSKRHPIHRLSTLVAITQMLDDDTDRANVRLTVSMPAGSYANKEEKDKYQEFYIGEKDIKIRVNERDYSFSIEDVIPLPEASGFTFKHSDLCKGKTTVIDIGHLNINFITLRDNNILQMISLDEGGREIESEAITRLEAHTQNEISRDVIVDTLIDGYYTQWGNIVDGTQKIIRDIKVKYVDDLIKKAMDRGIDLADQDHIYFIGGTSALLENIIKEHDRLKKISIVKNQAKWVTVEGNLIYANVIFNNINKKNRIEENE